MLFDTSKSILQELHHEWFDEKNCRVFVKRDDLIDAEVSGNKWRKLKYHLEQAHFLKKDGIVTVGGAFSNHLLAVASACHKAGIKSVGVVRGEELTSQSNPNLKRCTELGMELEFISRLDYADRNESWFKDDLLEKHRNFMFVPEGGSGYYGLIGCQELVKELPETVTDIFVAQGTTTTSCGILLGISDETVLHVVPVLKGFDSISEMKPILYPFCLDSNVIDDYLQKVQVHDSFHEGGYGKSSPELEKFIELCRIEFELSLDFVYTAKAFRALMYWVMNSPDAVDAEVVFIHTGGLHNA